MLLQILTVGIVPRTYTWYWCKDLAPDRSTSCSSHKIFIWIRSGVVIAWSNPAMASYAVTFTWEQDWGGVIFMRKMLILLAAGSNIIHMSVNVQCYTVVFFLPVWDIDNVMQLWSPLAMVNTILVTGIYVSYVRKIAVNRLDNIPWTMNRRNLTQLSWNSCTLNLVNDFMELRDLDELPSHVNLTVYGGGSAVTVMTQMVVVFQLVIWTVMLSSCWITEWRGMNFADL